MNLATSPKLQNMIIKGNIVTLRAMSEKDLQLVCDMFNDPELENLVVGWSFPISFEQQKKWFENHLNGFVR